MRDSPKFWAVLQLLGPDFDMAHGVLGGFAGVILIARSKGPGRKLAKTHVSLQNRPEVALASFGLGKSPLRILPIAICGYGSHLLRIRKHRFVRRELAVVVLGC